MPLSNGARPDLETCGTQNCHSDKESDPFVSIFDLWNHRLPISSPTPFFGLRFFEIFEPPFWPPRDSEDPGDPRHLPPAF